MKKAVTVRRVSKANSLTAFGHLHAAMQFKVRLTPKTPLQQTPITSKVWHTDEYSQVVTNITAVLHVLSN